jgi:hypothetical protein
MVDAHDGSTNSDGAPPSGRRAINNAETDAGQPASSEPVNSITDDHRGSARAAESASTVPSPVGATLTVGATVLGIAGGFIQVQDEPGKLWNMGAAVLAALVACLLFLAWRRGRPERRSGALQLPGAILSAAFAIALFLIAVLVNPAGRALSSTPLNPTLSIGSDPSKDIYMHEIMSSSTENIRSPLGKRDWAMTDFRVTQPYLRSIEVAAGPNGARIGLGVYDEHMQEVVSGETTVTRYRAKFTFEQPKDISKYAGSRLYLRATNIYGNELRVYFTNHDVDSGITSYLRCPNPRPLDCVNPRVQDLNALVVGRKIPW